jgi:HK97 family phage major capsid protein
LAAVMRAGATVIPMASKVVQVGRLTADPTATFRAEGSAITATDPALDNVQLTAQTLSALVIGSVEWWQDATAGGGADEIVHEALAKQIALTIDKAALLGGITTGAEQGGVGNNLLPSGGLPNPPNPRGILATLLAVASSSVLGGLTNGTVPTTYAELLDLIYTPRDFNEAPGALLWPSRLARKYAKFLDSQNNPMRVPADVDAIQKFVTNQLPSGMTQGTGTLMCDAIVGDFSQLLVGQRLDLVVQDLGELYAATGQRGVLCTWRGDIAPARPRAFAAYRFLQGV